MRKTDPEKTEKKHKRSYPIPATDQLNRIALNYLGRYASTEEALRRVLLNRVKRATRFNPDFADDGPAQEKARASIEQIIEKFRRQGVLNDALYAEAKASSLRRSGGSRRKIAQKLSHAGIKRPVLAHIFASEDNPEIIEEEAAKAFAKRKRLGPYRLNLREKAGDQPNDPDRFRKDLGSMARAGFSMPLALKVLKNPAD